MNDVLRADHITMRFGGLTAVDDFFISIKPMEIWGLIGPNGAGKTTIFNMVTGEYTPTEGRIYLKGKDITGLKPNVICGLGISRTFQNIRLFRDLTVLENVLVAHHLRLRSNIFEAVLGLPGYTRQERQMVKEAEELLDKVELWDVRMVKAGGLPYGRQRKLEIVRALATEPSLLLLDEPAAGMNPQETEELMDFIKMIRDEFKVTIALVEHDMKVVMGICERITVLDYGKIISEGTAEQVQNDPAVIKAYLGEDYIA
ncbi:MAG: ABC transporter ATP-binding protein [Thermotogae bacterium]|nr:ABC transporter ATP-binding protein [Thermotogota bacterium]